jgi:hypothetical protein
LAFQNFTSDNFLAGEVRIQTKSFFAKRICFKDNSTLLIADEKNKKTQEVYETTLQRLEAKP